MAHYRREPANEPDALAQSEQIRSENTSETDCTDQRVPLLSNRPAVTFPASEHHRPGWNQFILLGERRHVCVNNLSMVPA